METQLFLTREEVSELAPKAKETFIQGLKEFRGDAPWSFRQEFMGMTPDDVFHATIFMICEQNRLLAFQPNHVILLWNGFAGEWEDFVTDVECVTDVAMSEQSAAR